MTPKLRDVPTLTSMLTYTASPPSDQLLPPISYKSSSHTKLYDPPIEEFSVLLTNIISGESESFDAIDGPSILIITKLEGSASLNFGGKSMAIGREGQVFFVGAGMKIELLAREGSVTAYRAFVEVSE